MAKKGRKKVTTTNKTKTFNEESFINENTLNGNDDVTTKINTNEENIVDKEEKPIEKVEKEKIVDKEEKPIEKEKVDYVVEKKVEKENIGRGQSRLNRRMGV